MVYVDSWDTFVERSISLFRADPVATRYVMKYRHCDGKLVLKVTDNRECLKFKTDQAQDMRKMEKLNNLFFTMMARGPDDGNDKRDAESWGLTGFNLTLKFEIMVVDALVAAVVPEELPKEQAAPPPSKKGRGRRQ